MSKSSKIKNMLRGLKAQIKLWKLHILKYFLIIFPILLVKMYFIPKKKLHLFFYFCLKKCFHRLHKQELFLSQSSQMSLYTGNNQDWHHDCQLIRWRLKFAFKLNLLSKSTCFGPRSYSSLLRGHSQQELDLLGWYLRYHQQLILL